MKLSGSWMVFLAIITTGGLLVSLGSEIYPTWLLSAPVLFAFAGAAGAYSWSFGDTPGLTAMLAVSAIRYLVLPIWMLIEAGGPPSETVLAAERGWPLFLFEELLVVSAIWIAGARLRRTQSQARDLRTDGRGDLIFWVVLAVGLAAALAEPTILDRYNSIFSDSPVVRTGDIEAGIGSILFRWGKLVAFPLVVTVALKRAKSGSSLVWFTVSVVAMVATASFYTGSSRQSAVFPAVAAVFLLIRAFPLHKRLTSFLGVAVLYFALVTSSTQKFGDDYVDGIGSGTLQAYFNGPSNLGLSLDMGRAFGEHATLKNLYNDIFASVPLVPVDLEQRTVVFYNYTVYGGGVSQDQIIPFTGQVAFYGSWVALPIVIFALFALIVHFDKQFANTRQPVGCYLYAFSAVLLGVSFMLNLSIIMGYISLTVIPALAMIWISRRRGRTQNPKAKIARNFRERSMAQSG